MIICVVPLTAIPFTSAWLTRTRVFRKFQKSAQLRRFLRLFFLAIFLTLPREGVLVCCAVWAQKYGVILGVREEIEVATFLTQSVCAFSAQNFALHSPHFHGDSPDPSQIQALHAS